MKVVSKSRFSRFLALVLVFSMAAGMLGLTAQAVEPTSSARTTLPELKLWYDEPASQTVSDSSEYDRWQKATLPIGNGTIGAGIYGEIGTERLLLNEQTFWSGGPSENRPDYMGGNLIEGHGENGDTLQGIIDHYVKTGEIIDTGKLTGYQEWGDNGYGVYLSWGELRIATDGLTDASAVTDYQRWLSIDDAIAGVSFTSGGVDYTREYFMSHPGNVMAVKLTASQNTAFTITLPGNQQGGSTTLVGADTLCLSGQLADNQLKFASYLKAVPGANTTVTGSGSSLTVTGTEVTLFYSAATDYKQDYPVYRTGESDAELAERVLAKVDAAVTKGYDAVKNEHLADYHSFYDRMSLDLGQEASDKTTDVLLRAFNGGSASESERRLLEVTLFQYGRYLTIASSREDSQLPSNLQGIWNQNDRVQWHSDFHTNVNLQMNYWPVYVTNLTESADPLIRYIDSLREPGRVTAKVYAGIESTLDNPENGFMAHTQNTPYGWTCPGWSFSWGWAPAAIAWMLQNCWEHYEYTGDLTYMKNNIYPMMKEYCRLYDQILVDMTTGAHADEITDPNQDVVLASIPAYSPEHGPATAGNTFEHTLVWQLYEDTMTAANLLGIDSDKVGDENTPGTWAYNQAHLKGPIEIGDEGQIKEWYHETGISKDENGNTIGQGYGHRHLSHMLGLFPGDLVQTNEEWVEAARVSMENRTFTSTGWGMGQRINTWARLRDGKNAYQLICNLFNGGMYANLWDAHPPFQIDGNFGYTAGVAEMLMQSNMGFIDLMPALPDVWANGSYSGLVARGNFELAASWAESSLTEVNILSKNGGECAVKYPSLALAKVTDSKGNVIEFTVTDSDMISFPTAKGETYTITEIPAKLPVSDVGNAAAYRKDENTAEVFWDAVDGETYQVYRQIGNGDVIAVGTPVSDSHYTDEAAYEVLGEISYSVAAVGKAACEPFALADMRNVMFNDTYEAIIYSEGWGTWSDSACYSGNIHFIESIDTQNPESLEFTFYGTGIEVYGCTNTSNTAWGTMTAAIDGEGSDVVDFRAATRAHTQNIYTKSGLERGLHTITLTGVSGKIEFDALKVLDEGNAVEEPEELTIDTVGGVSKLWNAGDAVVFTTNAEGVTWTVESNQTHATTCAYPEHKYSWDESTLTLTAGLTDEQVTVTATKGSQTARKVITITPKTTVTIVEDSVSSSDGMNDAITWNGNWGTWWGESDRHHGGSKTENGTSFSYEFEGTGIAIYVQKYQGGGEMNVTIDGDDMGTYSLYDSGSGIDQTLLHNFDGLDNGTHTIVCTGVEKDGRTGLNMDFMAVYAPNPKAPTADISALVTAVDTAGSYHESSYTEASWAPLAAALETAGTYLNNTVQATQEQVDAAVAAIESAIDGLETKPLTVPTGLKVILTEGGALTVQWDTVSTATGYVVRVNGADEPGTSATTYRITGLEPGTAYQIAVKATNDKGEESALSAAITARTTDTAAPTQPTNLTWNGTTLRWAASTDTVGVTGYKVLVDGVEQSDKTTATSRTLTLPTADSVTIKVIAFDAAGNESAPAMLVVAAEYTVTPRNATANKSKFKAGEAVTVTASVADGHVLTGWTSAEVDLSGETATQITFSMPKKNVTVTAVTEEKNWTITTALTGLTSDLTAGQTVANGAGLSFKLSATIPNILPTTIEVKMGGQVLQSPWVTYNAITGAVSVREVTGDITVTAVAGTQAAGTYVITGTVTGLDGTAISGAMVEVYQGTTRVTYTTTDANGAYATQPLEAGGYSVEASAPGYAEKKKSVLMNDDNVTMDFQLGTALDKSGLQSAIDTAQSKFDNGQGNYTDASWTAFTEALEAAKEALTTATTQQALDAARTALRTAQSGLKTPSSGTSGGSASTSEPAEPVVREDGTTVTTEYKPDGTLVETVERDDGSKTETATARNGDVTITVTDPEGEVLAEVTVPAKIPEPETTFVDVPEGHWAKEAVDTVSALGLVKGVGGGLYDTTAPMTRGSLAIVLQRLSNGKADYRSTFVDVEAGKYYTEGVIWAAKTGVVKGITEDMFAPSQIITREQLAVMLVRYAKLIGMDTTADKTALEGFTDGDTTGSWAVDGVAWCVEKGILKGKGLNNLDPTADVTRIEVAVMLDRFIALIK